MASFEKVNVENTKRKCLSSFEPEEQEEYFTLSFLEMITFFREFTPSASKLQRRQPCYAPYRKTYQDTVTNKLTADKGLMHGSFN